MIAAIVGVTILVGDKLGIDRDQVLGDGLGVFSSFAFAGYLMAIGRLRLRQRSSTVMAASVVVTALCLLGLALATGESLLPRTLYGWADLLALALVSHALGQGLLTVALAHVSPTFSAVSSADLAGDGGAVRLAVLRRAAHAQSGDRRADRAREYPGGAARDVAEN